MTEPAPPLPMCFVAMPYEKRAPPGKDKPLIDFNRLYAFLEPTLRASDLQPIRADFDATGGFIHRPMYGQLMFAEYVVADLTFGNPNVTYEVGVRHGGGSGSTILICAKDFVSQLPFDLKALRVIPYTVQEDGGLTDGALKELGQALTLRIQQYRRGEVPQDNPIVQVTGVGPGTPTAHEKTDVFLLRMPYVNERTQRISLAIALPEEARDEALAQLDAIRDEVLRAPEIVVQLHTVLLALFLGYREKEAYGAMVELHKHLPAELRRTLVVREQLAFALNRLAEKAVKAKDEPQANRLRAEALEVIRRIPAQERNSETCGIHGRIFKGLYDAHRAAGRELEARVALGKAIDIYEEGLRLDPRDFYPGVNAVTLRIARSLPEDAAALERLLPVVRFSVERAPAPMSLRPADQYWQAATKLEVACAERDWSAASKYLDALLGLKLEPWMQPWMPETTAKNLRLQCDARQGESETVQRLEDMLAKLVPPKKS